MSNENVSGEEQGKAKAVLKTVDVIDDALPKLGALRGLDDRLTAATHRAEASEADADARELAADARASESERASAVRVEAANARAEAAEATASERSRMLTEINDQVARAEGKLSELRRALGVA